MITLSKHTASTGALQTLWKAARQHPSDGGRQELSYSPPPQTAVAPAEAEPRLLTSPPVAAGMEREKCWIPASHLKPSRSRGSRLCVGQRGEGRDPGSSAPFPQGAINPPTAKRNGAKAQIHCIYSGKTPRCKRWEFCLNK